MKFCTPHLAGVFSALNGAIGSVPAHAWFFLLLTLLVSPCLPAQQAKDETVPDKETMQLLLQRIAQLEAKAEKVDQLEARIKDLEAASKPQPHAVSAEALPVSPTPNLPPERETEPIAERPMSERMDVSKTLLRIRGFGDITLHGDDYKGDKTAFTLGQLDLFVTSDISERFKFLSEIVFEGGPDNIYGVPRGENNVFGVDVERLLLQYSQNDYFQLAVGRYHTAIGYYNTEFHHSTWFQTTTDRPFLFEFEDRGGILPIHNVGVSASGLIPSGPLGLHYVAEIGNGRESRSPLSEEPVQNINDENSHKAFNLALFAKPEAVRGLQTGFSFYHDLLTPAAAPAVGENIFAAHAVFDRSGFEWLNEALLIRHSPQGTSRVFNTPGFYTQVSKQFGAFRPYFRYQYVNAANTEPIFPDVGLRAGPSLGIRYDASDFVALKLQYDYTVLRNQPGVNGLALQLGFTF
jgi:hypothetical protein